MASWDDDQILEVQDDDLQESQTHSISRLAACTSNSTLDCDDDNHGTLSTMFSRLSIESFDADADADEEFSDGIYAFGGQENSTLFLDSDEDKGERIPVSYSLPATPLQEHRYQNDALFGKLIGNEAKQYLSDNNCEKVSRRKKRVLRRKKWEERKSETDDENSVGMKMNLSVGERGLSQNSFSFSGESEGGLRVITRPKGGRRSLCMGMEEVKACKDLGFELEHQQMFDMTAMPSRLTLSASTLDTTTTTSSGGSSPIPNWRISSPGDDPKDVKARLKIWAQAVALASSSSSRYGGT